MTGSRGNAAPEVINRSKIEKGIPEGCLFYDRPMRRARRGFAGGKRPGRSGELIQIELNAALDGCGGGLRGLLAAKKAAKLIPQDAG